MVSISFAVTINFAVALFAFLSMRKKETLNKLTTLHSGGVLNLCEINSFCSWQIIPE